jgi:hypothetical protein
LGGLGAPNSPKLALTEKVQSGPSSSNIFDGERDHDDGRSDGGRATAAPAEEEAAQAATSASG